MWFMDNGVKSLLLELFHIFKFDFVLMLGKLCVNCSLEIKLMVIGYCYCIESTVLVLFGFVLLWLEMCRLLRRYQYQMNGWQRLRNNRFHFFTRTQSSWKRSCRSPPDSQTSVLFLDLKGPSNLHSEVMFWWCSSMFYGSIGVWKITLARFYTTAPAPCPFSSLPEKPNNWNEGFRCSCTFLVDVRGIE